MKRKLLSLVLLLTLLLTACEAAAQQSPEASEPEPLILSEESATLPSEPEPAPSSKEEPVIVSEEEPTPSEEDPPESSEETLPAESKPAATEALSGVPVITDDMINDRLVRPLSELEALDNTAITWGPGPTSDERQPTAPLELQKTYGDYGALFIAPANDKIYLTFDEGYDAGYNGAILDTLKEKDAKAVFFITLGFAQSRPDLIRRMVDEGHVLGNHSWKHLSFPTMDMMACAKDVMTLHQFILDNFGYEMTVCRPPEGAFSTRSLALLDSLGYESMFWSFAYRDWIMEEQPTITDAFPIVVGRSHPGAIYLLHAVSSTNATILGDVIDQLREKGYEIATWSKE